MVAHIRTPDQRLRVFISSTLGELGDERRAARASVEQLRLTPVMFELGARPHPPRALYRSYLTQSDVFVGIYWQRYGWVAPDMDISGLEDELILSHGMPRLLYVKEPAPDLEPALARMLAGFEGENGASYKLFDSAEQLHELLLDDLALLLTERFGDPRGVRDVKPAARHNLPAPASTFVGRETEFRESRALIEDPEVRLITMRGTAGAGKTRLAIRLGYDVLDQFSDGVFFVNISAEREADRVFAAIARASGVAVPSGAQPVDVLNEELGNRSVLLLLDNFEQAMSAAVGVVELLEHCPNLKVIVTSREALHVRGERDFPVPPLSLPVHDDAESAARSEAVRLFCHRAAAVRPGFELTDDNAEAITAICRGLDGLPLAIELASARMQLLDVDELRDRLVDRLDVLRGARDLPERQQTLRDAIQWSYDLLDPHERNMLAMFAVFSGARLTDVEETAARVPTVDRIDVIEVLGSLVAKSLLHSNYGSDGGPRLTMLRTIRAYAIEQLDALPEFAADVRIAHAEQYCEVAFRLQQQLTSLGRSRVLGALADELSNMRAAWEHWVDRADVVRMNRMLAPLWGYYDARGDYRATIKLGTDLLEHLAETAESPERRRDEFAVRMSLVRTELAVHGYTADAEQLILDALARAEGAGDTRQRFPGLRSLGYLHVMRSDFKQTGEIARELMAIAEDEGDPLLLSEAHMLTGLSRGWQVGLTAALEHYDKAIGYAESASSGYIDFRVGTHPGVVANVVSALTHWMTGCPDTASATMQRALDLADALDHPYSKSYAMHHAGLLDLWRDDMERLAARTNALRDLAEMHDYPVWRALALVLGGVAEVRSGEVDLGLARSEEGFELYKGLSAPPVFWPALLMIRAIALGAAARSDDALTVIREAEATLRDGDPMAPDVGLVHADLLMIAVPSDAIAAEAVLERVAPLAGARGCRMAQLQALTRLATLRRGTPGEHETLHDLQQVYDTLDEGFDLPQLVAARAALTSSRPNGC